MIFLKKDKKYPENKIIFWYTNHQDGVKSLNQASKQEIDEKEEKLRLKIYFIVHPSYVNNMS